MGERCGALLSQVNHSPSFACDSPLDSAVKSHVLSSTMELVSFSREEHKLLKKSGARLEPGVRDRLAAMRNTYETRNCERCGFQQICPPLSSKPERAEELLRQYQYYLGVASLLYSDQSLRGSRRSTNSMSCACRTAVTQLKESASSTLTCDISNQLGAAPHDRSADTRVRCSLLPSRVLSSVRNPHLPTQILPRALLVLWNACLSVRFAFASLIQALPEALLHSQLAAGGMMSISLSDSLL